MIVDKDGALQIVSASQSGITTFTNSLNRINYAEAEPIASDIGFINYDTGEMMAQFKPSSITGTLSSSSIDTGDYIYFAAKPRIDDIIARENTIITIENSDITINCIDDSDRIQENKVRGY